jgi:hypothetical protein
MAGFVEGAGAVDLIGGESEFLLDGELGGDAAAGFGFGEAASEESVELLLRLAPGDDKTVEIFVNAGFDEEGGFNEGGIAHALALPIVELTQDDFGDAGMDDGVEAVEAGAIVENDGAEFCAVNAAIRGEDGGPKFAKDFVVGGPAGFDEFVGEGVGIENGKAEFAEHGGNGAFAAGDASGKAKSEHFLFSAPWRSIVWQKIWEKHGGGARL